MEDKNEKLPWHKVEVDKDGKIHARFSADGKTWIAPIKLNIAAAEMHAEELIRAAKEARRIIDEKLTNKKK